MEFKLDFKLLKISFILFVLSIIYTAVVIVGSDQIIGNSEKELSKEEAELALIKRKYTRTVNDQKLYSKYLVDFREMEKLGVVNGEKRLSWIESLQQINEALKLPILRHKLSPQTKVEIKNTNQNTFSQLTVKNSTMILTAGLFHELDLIAIFETLKKSKGMYTLRWCGLHSEVQKGVLSITRENILAECIIEWFSIDVKENNDNIR